jgi:hypothetical protein
VFGLQNLAVVVQEGINGGTWCHNKGCVEVNQLRVECVAIGSKLQKLVNFTPGGVNMLYINRGSLGNSNNPL